MVLEDGDCGVSVNYTRFLRERNILINRIFKPKTPHDFKSDICFYH